MRLALYLILITVLTCCSLNQDFDAKNKIFHAAGASGGVGGIYFALYKNNKYEICESGGIGETCYEGNYTVIGDTIILEELSEKSYIKNNRLLICRYDKLDSTYWQWKYPTNANHWRDMKWRDLAMDNSGDVHQMDNQNKLILDPTYYFVIRLDSLKNYR